jgi:putative molybdopterin biosynthesis protein
MTAGMSDLDFLRRASRQEQFLSIASRDEAEARFRAHLSMAPLGEERVALEAARGRVLAADVVADVDVPGFDRASVDGFAVASVDLAGISAQAPARLRLNAEVLTPGVLPTIALVPGTATPIATGGMLPRGADAVVMVEQTDDEEHDDGLGIVVTRPVGPGGFVASCGSDIGRGEIVLRGGTLLGAGEIGMLAAVGVAEVAVWRRPRVAIFSTGDEIVAPGSAIRAGQVFDSNAAILAATVEELGGEAIRLGIVADDEAAMAALLDRAMAAGDMVLLSGGTSKGAGDVAARVVATLADPGVVVHGVALKPGKPLCLAVSHGKPVAILPGFPTSAIMTFHEFIAPVLRAWAGLAPEQAAQATARLPVRVASEMGRMEYVLVSLVRGPEGLVAYPTGKGSGAVTSFTQADGFFAVPAMTESVAAGSEIRVQLIGAAREPAELVVIGSHCAGLDTLVGELAREGMRVRLLNVGSNGGLAAARRGECDIAPIHLMDPETGLYNTPFLAEGMELLRGYGRMQGVVFRQGDARFADGIQQGLAAALADPDCVMINRNPGSGTRILIDRLLGAARPPGHAAQAKSHNAVAAAVAQGRADWGVAIETVALRYGLGFWPLQAEFYDFVLPGARRDLPAVRRFAELLARPQTQAALARMGFATTRQEA